MSAEHPCDACGARPGRVHFVEIRGTEVKQQFLCEECARARGGIIPPPPPAVPPPPPPHAASGAIAFDWTALLAGAGASAGAAQCPACGHAWETFRKIGRMGCPECYSHFVSLLAPLLSRIAHESRHRGLRPPVPSTAEPGAPPPGEIFREIEDLRRRLRDAVKQENYEEAARIRDEIRTRTTGEIA